VLCIPEFVGEIIIACAYRLPDPKWNELTVGGVQVMAEENAGHGMAWDNPEGTADAIARALAS